MSDAAGRKSGAHWKVLAAIAFVQLFYWAIIWPVLFQAKPTPNSIPVTHAAFARLQSPDEAALKAAQFSPISLPYEACCDAGYRAARLHFTVTHIPADGLALVPVLGSDNFKIYVNDALLFADGEMTLPKISYHGNIRATFRIPPALLKVGQNELTFIMVRDTGTPFFSVGPPVIGAFAPIKAAFSYRQYSLNSFLAMSQGIGLAAALLAFILWLRSDRNPAIFWMALLCAAWALRIMHHRAAYPFVHGELRMVALYACVTIVPVALLNFANEWTGYPKRWITRLSIAGGGVNMVLVAGIMALGLFQKIDTADRISMSFALCCALVTAGLFVTHYARRAETRHWETAIFILCATLIIADAANPLFGLPYGDHVKRALPILLLGFVAPFFASNVRLFRSMSEFNALLKQQLAERTSALEEAHAREKGLVRVQAHQQERQRIMRDMHDGLGSQLMSMLLMARRGEAKPPVVAEGLQSVIDEMRLMIDSMDSVGESLSSAFSIFRERMHARVENAGHAFIWSNNAQDRLPHYGPRDVLQVFRVMQEAVTNALKHSSGKTISVSIKPMNDPAFPVRILITDDGKGPMRANPRGRGLINMEARAASFGARFAIEHDEVGVRILLDLPQESQHDE